MNGADIASAGTRPPAPNRPHEDGSARVGPITAILEIEFGVAGGTNRADDVRPGFDSNLIHGEHAFGTADNIPEGGMVALDLRIVGIGNSIYGDKDPALLVDRSEGCNAGCCVVAVRIEAVILEKGVIGVDGKIALQLGKGRPARRKLEQITPRQVRTEYLQVEVRVDQSRR